MLNNRTSRGKGAPLNFPGMWEGCCKSYFIPLLLLQVLLKTATIPKAPQISNLPEKYLNQCFLSVRQKYQDNQLKLYILPTQQSEGGEVPNWFTDCQWFIRAHWTYPNSTAVRGVRGVCKSDSICVIQPTVVGPTWHTFNDSTNERRLH